MVDFYEGGGVPAVLKEIEEYLHKDTLTVSGLTIGKELPRFSYTNNRNMIKTAEEPFAPTGGRRHIKGKHSAFRMCNRRRPCQSICSDIQAVPRFYHRGGILSGRTGRQSKTRHLHGPDVRGPKGGPGMPGDVQNHEVSGGYGAVRYMRPGLRTEGFRGPTADFSWVIFHRRHMSRGTLL